MKHIFLNLLKFNILILVTVMFLISSPNKIYADETFNYSDNIVENISAVMAHENGCGNREQFVYQLIWGGVLMNNYKRVVGLSTPITIDSLCTLFGGPYLWPDGVNRYCKYYFSTLESTGFGTCTQAQKEQLKLATKMVLSKSFVIPRNVYLAAEQSVIDRWGKEWVRYSPASWAQDMIFAYQNFDTISNYDMYGNTVRTDEQFYHELANCLYNNQTLYGAYNKCSGVSSTPAKYIVYLYPNGGTGITEGQAFEYTETTEFSKFPTVTRTGCTLDGWNLNSPDGKEYYYNIDNTDNGKKLYARWNCTNNQPSSSSQQSNQPSGDNSKTEKYTVTFKLNNNSNTIYWSEVIKSNENASEPEQKPTMDGYDFIGWMTADDKDFNFNTKITKNITLYAKWSKIEDSNQSNNQQEETKNQEEPKRTKTNDNPDTGSFNMIITLFLIIPTLIGVLYYYKYYIATNNNSTS